MNKATRSGIQLFSAYCGLFYMAALLLGWGVIAGFLPPPPPTTGEAEVAAYFLEEKTSIRIGMVIVMFAALIFIPFAALISHFLARIEGGSGVLASTALLG